jgi:hypothetical protein
MSDTRLGFYDCDCSGWPGGHHPECKYAKPAPRKTVILHVKCVTCRRERGVENPHYFQDGSLALTAGRDEPCPCGSYAAVPFPALLGQDLAAVDSWLVLDLKPEEDDADKYVLEAWKRLKARLEATKEK